MTERRDGARRRVCLGGFVETAAFLPDLPCTVRDVSLDGARIRVEGRLPAGRIRLSVPIRGEQRIGRVIWQVGNEAGIRFEPLEVVAPVPYRPAAGQKTEAADLDALGAEPPTGSVH